MRVADEFNFIRSTKSFQHLKSIIDLVLKKPELKEKPLSSLCEIVAKEKKISMETVYMGIYRAFSTGVIKTNPKYPNINLDLKSKELITRLIDICEQEGREF